MSSTETVAATLDLLANYSPRSFCVFGSPPPQATQTATISTGASSSSNPFEAAAHDGPHHHHSQHHHSKQNEVMGVLYGTERGSLHYRCFAVNNNSNKANSSRSMNSKQQRMLSSPSSSSMSGGGGAGGILAPLGVSQQQQGGGRSARNSSIPRGHFPVDLPPSTTSLISGGAIVACIDIHIADTTNNIPGLTSTTDSTSLFLVLVDDQRGPSGANSGGGGGTPAHHHHNRHAGAYAARWVTLNHGVSGSSVGGNAGSGFQVYSTISIPTSSVAASKSSSNMSNQALPRMSAAVFQHGRLYYTAGRGIYTMTPPKMASSGHFRHHYHAADRGAGSKKTSSKSVIVVPANLIFGHYVWPAAARSGPDAMTVVANGRVVVACVGHAFYAAAGQEPDEDDDNNNNLGSSQQNNAATAVKLVTLTQSSQVHPVICLDLQDQSVEADWSSLFVASGRECAVVDLYFGPSHSTFSQARLSCSKPRSSGVTTPSPILAAASSWPLLCLLTSDGLISIRSPSCLAISLRTVEVGTRPNDFFALRRPEEALSYWSNNSAATTAPQIVAASHAGQAKVLQCKPDTAQDLADRLMRHAIDAFGANGFCRTELAEAVQASFTATSYVGPSTSETPTSSSSSSAQPQAKMLLKEYLEAVLGLCDWESGAASGWPTEFSLQRQGLGQQPYTQQQGVGDSFHGRFDRSAGVDGGAGGAGDHHHQHHHHGGGGTTDVSSPATVVLTAAQPSALLTATALLCLVCSQLSPPLSSIANRAAKASASKLGVVVVAPDGSNSGSGGGGSSGQEKAAAIVCEQVADKLLREASQAFSLLRSSSPSPIITRIHRPANLHTDFVEAAIWLLRSCGQHERALSVAAERLQNPPSIEGGGGGGGAANDRRAGLWSRIKYESYTATHLSELWASGTEEGHNLVLRSPVTHRLLESNPRMGLSVFTAMHPRNEAQWRAMSFRDDPLLQYEVSHKVVELLKSIVPTVPYDQQNSPTSVNTMKTTTTFEQDGGEGAVLPLESGRALAVTFLESAMGMTTGRPTEHDEFDHLAPDTEEEEHLCNIHDELSFLLLEGVISERSDDANDQSDTDLGKIYRHKLRQLLRWPLAKIRPHHFLESLPPSFLQEKALVLGRLGNHEDALRILYRDLGSLELALEYCDERYERQLAQQERRRARQNQSHMFADHESPEEVNAYLPLVQVALESEDTEKGCRTAIQVLALRRSAIDRAAALHLLPSDVPVSAVARPFLIPALVDSESQVRRLTVVSALLRARYLRLKEELTAAQLRAQANLHVVPQLRSLNLGDPLHSTKPFRARTSTGNVNNSMPEVWIVKHYFARHLVIQAKVTNREVAAPTMSGGKAGQRTLTDIAFVVAESSEEEAIQPIQVVTIPVLPSKMTGSCWCVLSAAPGRMEGATAQLTCELRFTVVGRGEAAMLAAAGAEQKSAIMGRNFVEELQDLEVHASHFS